MSPFLIHGKCRLFHWKIKMLRSGVARVYNIKWFFEENFLF